MTTDKKIFLAIAVFLGLFLLLYSTRTKKETEKSGKMKIVSSFYPASFLVRKIAGDNGEVTQIIPVGAEPHEYEPSPGQLKELLDSSVFIYNGFHLEPWAEKMTDEIQKKNIQTVRLSDGISPIKKDQGEDDPHIWLDPTVLINAAGRVKDILILNDPSESDLYEKNEKDLVDALRKLDEDFKKGLADCSKKQIVVSHDAFSYFARRYGFSTIPISGINSQEEPSAGKLSEITKLVNRDGIKYIFFETLVNPKLSEIIAKETGAKTAVLNPLPNLTKEEVRSGKDYLSIMEDNLANLRLALECR